MLHCISQAIYFSDYTRAYHTTFHAEFKFLREGESLSLTLNVQFQMPQTICPLESVKIASH
jgi:hypothetical protein